MSYNLDEFIERHSRTLERETETIERSTLFLPEGLTESQIGAARMIIRHSFRSGYVLKGSIDPTSVTDVTANQLFETFGFSDEERGVMTQFPAIADLAIKACQEGARIE